MWNTEVANEFIVVTRLLFFSLNWNYAEQVKANFN